MGREVVVAVTEQAHHRSRDSGRGGVLAEQVRQAGWHHRPRLEPANLANHPPTIRQPPLLACQLRHDQDQHEVDQENVSDDVEPRMLLVQYLREKLGKTGTVIGCDTSNCGACTVHLNGRSVKSCNVLAVQADGATVDTIERLASDDGTLHPVQEAFRECHGLQCGFCTPGMIMQAVDLLNENPNPTEEEVRLGLEGNLCRCTGYHNIVKSVLYAAQLGGAQAQAEGANA